MFTKKQLKQMKARIEKQNPFDHKEVEYCKWLCPVANKVVDVVFTDHERPGTAGHYNICKHCCTDAEAAKYSSIGSMLSNVNEQRRRESESNKQ